MSKSISVRRSGRVPAALLSVAALAATGAIATAGPAGAVITRGGTTGADGLATMYRDAQGAAVAQCADAAFCPPVANGDGPMYYSADASVGALRATWVLEGIFLEDAAGNPTNELAISNSALFRADGLQANKRYTITDPWGTHHCIADGDGSLGNKNCLFEGGGEGGGAVGSGPVKSLLRAVNAPAGFFGPLDAARKVTGSPSGFNRVTLTGPGVNIGTSFFTVNGQMPAGTAMTTVGTDALKLGSITKATASTATIPVTSFGTAAANFTVAKSGANPGAFQVQIPASVASGSAGSISVTYTPKANRNVSAVLTIDDNGLATPRTVTLTGVAHDTRAPKVLSSTPARGAANVAAGRSLKVKFSEAVVSAKTSLSVVDAAGHKVGAKVSRVGKTNTYLLNPGHALAGGAKYTVKVNGGKKALRDPAGNPAKDAQWSFRTR
jgi:methionine-rich copper-binding protein CopC